MIDLDPEDEDFGTHWRVKSTGEKIEKDKTLLVSTQTGFEMIKSRLIFHLFKKYNSVPPMTCPGGCHRWLPSRPSGARGTWHAG